MQTAEVAVRNAIQTVLMEQYGAGWYSNQALINVLADRYKDKLRETTLKEQGDRGVAFTGDHVVAALPFGFWTHLLSPGFQHLLWKNGMHVGFANIPNHVGRRQVHDRVDRLRNFRNKVMHHYAIFHHHVLDEHTNAMNIIGWVSADLEWFAKQLTNPQVAMAARPRA